jgi:uncharacterized protein
VRGIDANIILRYLTNDVPDQADRAEALLRRLEAGTELAFLPDIALADIIGILEGYYKKSRVQIGSWLTSIISLPGIEFSDKEVAFSALDIFVQQAVDWSDAFMAAQMAGRSMTEIYTFDRHFERTKVITGVEP